MELLCKMEPKRLTCNCSLPDPIPAYRYSVRVKADIVATVHFRSSNPDVLIRLSVLDHEKEVAGANGKGHSLIPIFHFLSDQGMVLQNTTQHFSVV